MFIFVVRIKWMKKQHKISNTFEYELFLSRIYATLVFKVTKI
jgi:hypothetical protein